MNTLIRQLHVPDGIISIIGSGGKTTFLRAMADTLPGHTLLTTTTHILPFPGIPTIHTHPGSSESEILEQIRNLFSHHKIICIGTPEASGKLASPCIDPALFLPLADHILIETDGSKHLPLKAHRSTEPVIHPLSAYTICIVGASGIDQPIGEVCHCPQIFCELTGSRMTDLATPERIALALNKEALADCYFINQTDLIPDTTKIHTICRQLKKSAFTGSLQKRVF